MENDETLLAVSDLEKQANKAQRLAGLIWSAANIGFIIKGGLSKDIYLAGSGLATTAASGSAAIFGDRANAFSGPTFLASTAVYSGENFRNGWNNDSGSSYMEAAFGIGVFAGISVLYYGKALYDFAQKSRPVARLLNKLPDVDQGSLAKGLFYISYAIEVGRGISSLYYGAVTGDWREGLQGGINLALIGTYCVGNKFAAKAANLRNSIDRAKQDLFQQPSPFS